LQLRFGGKKKKDLLPSESGLRVRVQDARRDIDSCALAGKKDLTYHGQRPAFQEKSGELDLKEKEK